MHGPWTDVLVSLINKQSSYNYAMYHRNNVILRNSDHLLSLYY